MNTLRLARLIAGAEWIRLRDRAGLPVTDAALERWRRRARRWAHRQVSP